MTLCALFYKGFGLSFYILEAPLPLLTLRTYGAKA